MELSLGPSVSLHSALYPASSSFGGPIWSSESKSNSLPLPSPSTSLIDSSLVKHLLESVSQMGDKRRTELAHVGRRNRKSRLKRDSNNSNGNRISDEQIDSGPSLALGKSLFGDTFRLHQNTDEDYDTLYSSYSTGRRYNQHKNKRPVHAPMSQQTVNGLLSLLLLFIISTCGCMGSIFIISALTVIESLQTRGNCYLVSLALAHLLVTLLVIPSSALQIMAGDGINAQTLCHYQWLTLEFSLIVSQLSFMLIAADNYLGYKSSEKVTTQADLLVPSNCLSQQQQQQQLSEAFNKQVTRDSTPLVSPRHQEHRQQQQQQQQQQNVPLISKQSPTNEISEDGCFGELIRSRTACLWSRSPANTIHHTKDLSWHQLLGSNQAKLMRHRCVSYRDCCSKLKVLIWILLVWLLAISYTLYQHSLRFGPNFCAPLTTMGKSQPSSNIYLPSRSVHLKLATGEPERAIKRRFVRESLSSKSEWNGKDSRSRSGAVLLDLLQRSIQDRPTMEAGMTKRSHYLEQGSANATDETRGLDGLMEKYDLARLYNRVRAKLNGSSGLGGGVNKQKRVKLLAGRNNEEDLQQQQDADQRSQLNEKREAYHLLGRPHEHIAFERLDYYNNEKGKVTLKASTTNNLWTLCHSYHRNKLKRGSMQTPFEKGCCDKYYDNCNNSNKEAPITGSSYSSPLATATSERTSKALVEVNEKSTSPTAPTPIQTFLLHLTLANKQNRPYSGNDIKLPLDNNRQVSAHRLKDQSVSSTSSLRFKRQSPLLNTISIASRSYADHADFRDSSSLRKEFMNNNYNNNNNLDRGQLLEGSISYQSPTDTKRRRSSYDVNKDSDSSKVWSPYMNSRATKLLDAKSQPMLNSSITSLSNNGDSSKATQTLFWPMIIGAIVVPSLASIILFTRAYLRMKEFKMRPYKPIPLAAVNSNLMLMPNSPLPVVAQYQTYTFAPQGRPPSDDRSPVEPFRRHSSNGSASNEAPSLDYAIAGTPVNGRLSKEGSRSVSQHSEVQVFSGPPDESSDLYKTTQNSYHLSVPTENSNLHIPSKGLASQQQCPKHQQLYQALSAPTSYDQHLRGHELRALSPRSNASGHLSRMSPLHPETNSQTGLTANIQRDVSFSAPPSATIRQDLCSLDGQQPFSSNINDPDGRILMSGSSEPPERQETNEPHQQLPEQGYEFRRHQNHAKSFHYGCSQRQHDLRFRPNNFEPLRWPSRADKVASGNLWTEDENHLERHRSLPHSSRLHHPDYDQARAVKPSQVKEMQQRQQHHHASQQSKCVHERSSPISLSSNHTTQDPRDSPAVAPSDEAAAVARALAEVIKTRKKSISPLELSPSPKMEEKNRCVQQLRMDTQLNGNLPNVINKPEDARNAVKESKAIFCTYSYMTDDQLLKSNIIVFIVNLILWLPFILLSVVAQYRDQVKPEIKNVVWWLATLNCCFCSYVYALTNKDFREAFNKLFYYCCCKSHVNFQRKMPIFRRQLDLDSKGNLRIHIIPGLNVYSSRFSKGLESNNSSFPAQGLNVDPIEAQCSHHGACGPISSLRKDHHHLGGGFGGPLFASSKSFSSGHHHSIDRARRRSGFYHPGKRSSGEL